ncbi:MAG: hypothetical protein AB1898_14425 [Acidobacteriota bacterium]
MPTARLGRFGWTAYLLVFLNACATTGVREAERIEEASGVARRGESLLVVDDSAAGRFFEVPLQGTDSFFPLNRAGMRAVTVDQGSLALDLEGICLLADGRVVLLSERLCALVGERGLVASYEGMVSEFGRRGLEGVCARPLPDGSSRVAVLWEGGYPDAHFVPPTVKQCLGHSALQPFILVHDLGRGAANVKVHRRDLRQQVTLDVPLPPGNEPDAQRFRAPDLVWYRWPDKEDSWGFLVLISSQNSVERPEYLYHWLQRFDEEGRPVGNPLDLADYLPASVKAANWEGLGWYEPGKQLALVHEGEAGSPPHAFLLTLPESWQTRLE